MIEKECKRHGLTKHRLEGAKKHLRCVKCRTERITNARRELKKDLVRLLGAECKTCGYSKCVWALHFHHLDGKEATISHLIRDRKRDQAFAEVSKCILLCANCHAEEEAKKIGLNFIGIAVDD